MGCGLEKREGPGREGHGEDRKEEERRTLQKSMDLTPLLPRAGPTGGEGEACPAPTMSLTICSRAGSLRAMLWDG